MLVSVEDAPHFIMRLAQAAALLASFTTLRLDGAVHELKRAAVELVDGDNRRIPELSTPIHEIAVLRTLALCEDQELAPRNRRAGAAERPSRLTRRQWSAEVISSAAAANW